MASKRTERFSLVLGAVDKISAPIRRVNRRVESMLAPIRKVRRQMSALTREAGFGKLGGAIKGVGTQFARLGAIGAVAVGGLFVALTRTAETMDNLAKRTRNLDFPVDQFQRWKQVAQLAGVGAEAFDKSVQKLSKNIGELRLNTGTMSTILDKADPAFKKQLVNSKSNAEAFDLVIDRMRSLTNAQDRAALANAAFGRAGKDLIGIANLSAAEVAKLREQVSANGGIISGEALKNAEIFADSLLLVKTAISNIWNEIAGNLFPIVTAMMDRLRAWTVANKELIQVKVVAFLEAFVAGGKSIFAFLKEWIPPTIELVKALGGMKFVLGVIAFTILAPLLASVAALGAAFASTAGLVVLAMAGISAAIAIVVQNWEGLKANFLDNAIGNTFGVIADTFSGLFGGPQLAGVPGAGSAPQSSAAGTPGSSLRVKIDQAGSVTGVEVESGSVEVETEGLVNESF